jgi:exodeoxyribonuclease VII large subunit
MSQLNLFEPEPYIRTVAEITRYLRQKIDSDASLRDIWLRGEISNWKQAPSGHIYFTLKDSDATIRAVIWRSKVAGLKYRPHQEGEAVEAHGYISIYEAGGSYQFYVDALEPVGQGSLYAQFEKIKARLAGEGLFEPERKQMLPEAPGVIGIVTSAGAAALQDILNVLRRRFPLASVILAPTLVQGESAPAQIVSALTAISRQPVEVIILARGGGSIEDLWAFNDEAVARAIAACPIPVVSGVGHETDFTIADFVADVRAPTPSAAAEMVSPDLAEMRRQLYEIQLILAEMLEQQLKDARHSVDTQLWALERMSPQNRVNNYRHRVDSMSETAHRAMSYSLSLRRQEVKNLSDRLATLNPRATLVRGYAVVQKGGAVITEAAQVLANDEITVQLQDGSLEATVSRVWE